MFIYNLKSAILKHCLNNSLQFLNHFFQRLIGSLKTGATPHDADDDDCSVATGDTDIRSPLPSRLAPPHTPLIHDSSTLIGHFHQQLGQSHTSHAHTLFSQPRPNMSFEHEPMPVDPGFNSQSTDRDKERNPPRRKRTMKSTGYGTLQFERPKTNVEVVVRSTSHGDVARL